MICNREILKSIKAVLDIRKVTFPYNVVLYHVCGSASLPMVFSYFKKVQEVSLCLYFHCSFIFKAHYFPQEVTKEFHSFQVSSLYVFRYRELRYFYLKKKHRGKCGKISGIN